MSPKQKNRLIIVVSIFILLSTACGLVLYALKQNINLFLTPTQLKSASIAADQTVRIGGYVKDKSVHYDATGTKVEFIVTDRKHELLVQYAGVLPNLFREGQTVIVTGFLVPDKKLIAEQVLAKHDEKYMPKSLANELNKEKTNAA